MELFEYQKEQIFGVHWRGKKHPHPKYYINQTQISQVWPNITIFDPILQF